MQSKVLLGGLGLLALGHTAAATGAFAAEPATAAAKPPAAAVAAKGAAPSLALAKTFVVRSTGYRAAAPSAAAGEKRVSLDFVAADINDVLKALALQAGVNIVTAADVKGNITVSLARVSVTDALDMVARLSGYQYAKVGPAYIVGSAKSVADLGGNVGGPAKADPVTEFIPYRFAKTGDLGKQLQLRFPDVQQVVDDKADEKATPSQPRTVAVTGTPDRVAAVRAFVKEFEQTQSFPQAGAVTEVYQVKYTSAADLTGILSRLAPTVQVTLGPSQGFQSGSTGASASFSNGGAAQAAASGAGTANPPGAVASGSAPNSLLLTGAPDDVARAREVLTQVDVRAPQMVFEAKVMDVSNADLSRIGLSYDFGRRVDIGESNTRALEGVGSPEQPARRLPFGAILRSPYSVGLNLDLLAQNNQGRLLANPNISALDGQPAVVFIGDQVKYVIRQEVTPTGTNIQTETATVGITLKVTGKASPDGTITLYVHPEVSVISGFLNAGNGISLPQIASRYVDTTIRVKDGETIAIGGLIRESDITNIRKVPFLGDLPFFGQLFKSTEKNKSRSEIVIFITSRILKD